VIQWDISFLPTVSPICAKGIWKKSKFRRKIEVIFLLLIYARFLVLVSENNGHIGNLNLLLKQICWLGLHKIIRIHFSEAILYKIYNSITKDTTSGTFN